MPIMRLSESLLELGALQEGPHHPRVPLMAGAVLQDRRRLFEGHSVPVGPVARHWAVCIDDGDNSGAHRYLLPDQPVGVAPAVPTLVVMVDDRVGVHQKAHAFADLAAGIAMLLDNRVLLRRQPAGLLED